MRFAALVPPSSRSKAKAQVRSIRS